MKKQFDYRKVVILIIIIFISWLYDKYLIEIDNFFWIYSLGYISSWVGNKNYLSD